MPKLSQCLDRFAPSRIGQVFELATRLKNEGRTIHDLSIGEPDFDTVPAAIEAGHWAIDTGDTKYTETLGSAPMKAAVRRKFLSDGHPEYADGQLAIGNGAKPLLAHIFMTLLDAGDEVIIPTPCWSSHPGMVQVLGATAVFVPCTAETRYKLSANALSAAITPKTRVLILCSPGNPTGGLYSADDLRALAAVLAAHPEIWVVADEIYSEITFDDLPHTSLAVAAPELAHRIVTVNGVSKSYAMTGWRIGYAAGPEEMMAGLAKLSSQVGGSPSSIGQTASIAALDGPQDALAERRAIYQSRRDAVLRHLAQVPELQPVSPQGAFYLYIDCTGALGRTTPDGTKIATSADLAAYFLNSAGVAVVPAEAFESEGAFRISFASSMDVLDSACEGIKQACRDLS